ncbi:MAG: hypothetical protein IJ848_02585 [Alphaproteobacteria bacterium]|nr:hypothetical protein [Alphaproteobacteria bacterium]
MKKQIIMLSIIPFLLGNSVNATSEQSSQSFDTVLNAMMGPKFEKLDNDVKNINSKLNTFENKLGTLETKLSSFDPAKQVQQTNDQIKNILDTKLIEIQKENESQDMQITNLKNEVNDLKTSNDDRNNKDLAEEEYNALIKASTSEERQKILDKYPKLKQVLGDDLEKYISGNMPFPQNIKDILYSALSNDDAKLNDFMANDIISKLTSTSISLDDKKKLLEKHPEIKTLLGNPTDMDGYLNGTMQFPQDFDKKLSEKLSTPSSGQEASTEITGNSNTPDGSNNSEQQFGAEKNDNPNSNSQDEATKVGQESNTELNSVTNDNTQLEKTKQEKFQEYANNLATEKDRNGVVSDVQNVVQNVSDNVKLMNDELQQAKTPEEREAILQKYPEIANNLSEDVKNNFMNGVPLSPIDIDNIALSSLNKNEANDYVIQQLNDPSVDMVRKQALLAKYPEISNMISEEDKKNLAKGIQLTPEVTNNIKSKLSENLDNNNVPQTSNNSKKAYNNLVKGIANIDAAQERLGIKKFTDKNGNNVPISETNDVTSSENTASNELEKNYVEKEKSDKHFDKYINNSDLAISPLEKLSVSEHKYKEAEDIDSRVLKKTKEKYKTLFEQTKAELEMAKADLKACEEKCKVSTEQLNQTNAVLQQVTSNQVGQPEILAPQPIEPSAVDSNALQIEQPAIDPNAVQQQIIEQPEIASNPNVVSVQPGAQSVAQPQGVEQQQPGVEPQLEGQEQTVVDATNQIITPTVAPVVLGQLAEQPVEVPAQAIDQNVSTNVVPGTEGTQVVTPTVEPAQEGAQIAPPVVEPVQEGTQVVTPTVEPAQEGAQVVTNNGETAAVVEPTTGQSVEVPVQAINQNVSTNVVPGTEGTQVVTPTVEPAQEGAQVVTNNGETAVVVEPATEQPVEVPVQATDQTVPTNVVPVQEGAQIAPPVVEPVQEGTQVVTPTVEPAQEGAQVVTNNGETAVVVEPTTEQPVEVPAQAIDQNVSTNVVPEQNIAQIQEQPAEDVSMQNATVTTDNEQAQQEVAESGEGDNQLTEEQNPQEQDVNQQIPELQNVEDGSNLDLQNEAQQYNEEEALGYDIQDKDFEQYGEYGDEESFLGDEEAFEQDANGVFNDTELNLQDNEVNQLDEQVQGANQQQPDTQNEEQPNVEELAQVEEQNEAQPNIEGQAQPVEEQLENPGKNQTNVEEQQPIAETAQTEKQLTQTEEQVQNEVQPSVEGTEQPGDQSAEQPQGEVPQQIVEGHTPPTEEQVQDENQQILAEKQINEGQVPSVEPQQPDGGQIGEIHNEEMITNENQQQLENQGEKQVNAEEQQLNEEQDRNKNTSQTLEKKVDALADFTEAFTNSNG